jgi:general transcription factor 3C polypeptide 5 (transcription factor C subunit 1)
LTFFTLQSNMANTELPAEKQHAPWLPIPSRAVSAVEHPAIIKNIDKGIASLGGPVKLSKVSRLSQYLPRC